MNILISGEMILLRKDFQANMKKYIKEKIEDSRGYINVQFRKFKRDYKSFLLVFFAWIILGLFNYLFNLIENLQDKILIPILIIIIFSWLFYTVKVVIDTFRIFKTIKPSGLQIGISIFLFWLFWSPLVMGLYVIHLMNKINLGDLGHKTSFEPFKPSEESLSVFLAAQFISKEATVHTKVLVEQFPNYFLDMRIIRQFYADMLCLYVNIYHRLGAGMIKEKKSILSVVTLDERIGFFMGTCCRIIEEHSKEFPFLQSISLQFLKDAYEEFHNWSRQYEIIYDAKNELSVKFDADQIVGFSFRGQNTLVINFIAKEIAAISIKENDLGKYIFRLSDLIAQYLSAPILKSFLADYLSDPVMRRLIDEEIEYNRKMQRQSKREGEIRRST
jgi:hypothetical protein